MLTKDQVDLAFRRLRHDIEATAGNARSGAVTEVAEGVEVRYGGHRFPVSCDLTFAELLVEISDRIQDDVTDDLGRSWPSRDGGHPFRAAVANGEATWLDGDVVISIIGQLSP